MKHLHISLIIIALILHNMNIFSQNTSDNHEIIFHDYDPDIIIIDDECEIDTFKIDLDKNGYDDIQFYIGITSGGNFQTLLSPNPNSQFTLLENEKSDSLTSNTLNWQSYYVYLMGINNSEKCGVKIISDNNTYYGWIHVIFSFENNKWIIIIDKYAFCTIPDYPLLWGQTTLTGIEEPGLAKTVRAFVNQQEKQVSVITAKRIKQVKLVNMNGTTVTTIKKVNTTSATLNTAGLSGGAYLVRVTLNNGNV
ncbi:MAG: T9SS type A sorting domain-containing protein, partial [Prolixibacteraceae bacterium]|nr:T9SS type A sorting domain-containing protein [Prolixibacteraceae bacterium]